MNVYLLLWIVLWIFLAHLLCVFVFLIVHVRHTWTEINVELRPSVRLTDQRGENKAWKSEPAENNGWVSKHRVLYISSQRSVCVCVCVTVSLFVVKCFVVYVCVLSEYFIIVKSQRLSHTHTHTHTHRFSFSSFCFFVFYLDLSFQWTAFVLILFKPNSFCFIPGLCCPHVVCLCPTYRQWTTVLPSPPSYCSCHFANLLTNWRMERLERGVSL